ncbi:NAD(P)/FAD-dependent oxidoreductase [Roseicella aerolata]|uniref:FAD-dependent monooxygenase n=1 Tax=Roseicella aerolata TaxID=2883479 RepID=A0A9X1IAQ3_9PROT|nr:FAD-dependent monooxygenase [Roseicella aerolata]MCB4821346.1 FAD-dependent monooxygenase [Roseicella aerolata]
MFARRSYDVLVVGARCAGAATAMLLARRGLRVLCIDRGHYGADTVSTHALAQGGVLQLRRWGLLPRIAAETPAIRRAAIHYGDDRVEVAQPGPGSDALFAPRRSLLDRVLVDAAREAGAEVRHGCCLVELLRRADGRVTGAVILDGAGRRAGIAAGLVVGADGLGSAVVRLTGAPVLRQGLHASAILYDHWAGLRAEGLGRYWREGVSAGAIPTSDGRHCVFAALPAARLRAGAGEGSAALYRRVLAACAPALAKALAGARPEGRLTVFGGRRGTLRQAHGPGWALVGDAAGFTDPLALHGMTGALRDAELLARAAARGSAAAFAGYAAARDALSLPLLAAGDAIASFAWSLETLPAQHRALDRAMRVEAEHLLALDPTPAAWRQERAA